MSAETLPLARLCELGQGRPPIPNFALGFQACVREHLVAKTFTGAREGFRSMVHTCWRRKFLAMLVLACVFALPAAGEPLLPKALLSVDPPLSVDDDEATNVSGAACFIEQGVRKSCLLIGDEVRYARLFKIEDNKIVPGEKLFLLPERDENNKKFKETDAEGIAFSDGAYYIIGSHGLNQSGKKQPSRYFVYRIRAPSDTGRPDDLGTNEKASSSVERSAVLDHLIAEDPLLGAHTGDIPGKQGVNIEGIAAAGPDLLVGFRGPTDHGAIILQVPIKTVFDGDKSPPQRHLINLNGEGVRDLAAVNGGFMILTGPEERKPGRARVFFWNTQSVHQLADLGGPRDDKGQPEALLLLNESATHYTVMVFSDGPVGGAPTVYEIQK